LTDLLEALRAPGAPAAGTALAYAAAMAAALGEMCAAGSSEAEALRFAGERLLELAERDALAYRAYEAAGPERAEAVAEAIAVPLAIAREARSVWARLHPLRDRVKPPRRADLDVALELLRVATGGAARLARFNSQVAGAPGWEQEARQLESWAEEAEGRGSRELDG
jgi:formiminotetrahydrofolate cyclodeaminase